MARARNIKPGFHKNDVLAECTPLARLLFTGLWTIADRDGRGEYRAKMIKVEVLPYDECNVDELMWELCEREFVHVYEHDDKLLFEIPTFKTHQNPHRDEKTRNFPASTVQVRCKYGANTIQEQKWHRSSPDESLLPITESCLPLVRRDETQSEPEPDDTPEPVEESPIVEIFPCDGKPDRFDVRQLLIDEFAGLFPKLDVPSEVRSARAWVLGSPERRKTSKGMRRFLTGWLTRSNDKYRSTGPPGSRPRPGVDPDSFPSE